MEARDELIKCLANLPAERAKLREKFAAEVRNGPNLEIPLASYADAITYSRRHRDMMALAQAAVDELSNFDTGTRIAAQDMRDQIRKATPAVLADAIATLERDIESRKAVGVLTEHDFAFGLRKSPRTPADEASTVRAEQALGKLEALATVPGDIGPKVRAVLNDLHKADLAALGQQAAAKVKPATSDGDGPPPLELALSGSEGRLYPAG